MPEAALRTSSFQKHLYGAAGLSLLIVLYLLPGAVGHDPWRGDDVRHFSAVYAMLRGDSLLFPAIAGEAAMEFGPLYYWVSALFATALGWLIPLHDAARLATPLFAGLSIFWIARAASRLYGKHTRVAAALLTVGTLGLVVHAHENQPMIALMAMQAMTLAGLALMPTQPVKGALQTAAGTALAFLAAGPLGLLLTLPLMLIVAIGSPECRNPRASGALILGLTAALAASAIWPVALNLHHPEQLILWWQETWAAFASDPFTSTDWPRLLELLGWFTWPLWPIALWSLWRARHQLTQLPWLLPLTSIALACAWIYANGSFDPVSLLPLIPPLALLAGVGAPALRRGAANAFDWFAVMTFTVFGVLIWLAWSAQAFQWPPGLSRSLDRMAPEWVLVGTSYQAAIGIAIVIIWALLVWRLPRGPNRGPSNWAMGMTMLWCLAVTLLLPWFDHSRNYRPVAESLSLAVAGEGPGCVAGLGLSSSHRAAFDYFVDLDIAPAVRNETACRYILVQDDEAPPRLRPSLPWEQVWEYRHAGGRQLEIFQLFRRD